MDLVTKKFFVTRDVQFVEHIIPFQYSVSFESHSSPLFPSISSDLLYTDDPQDSSFPRDQISPTSTLAHDPEIQPTVSTPDLLTSSDFVPDPLLAENIIPTTPFRTKHLPSKFKIFTGLPAHLTIALVSTTNPSNNSTIFQSTPYPLANYLSYDSFSLSYMKYLAATTIIPELTTYIQAVKYDH